MSTQVFLHRPRDFNPAVEAAGVFCEYQDRLLFLKRHPDKVEGLRWGTPGGKMEPGEQPIETARRELAEEVGIYSSSLLPIAPIYIRRAGANFIFHMFFLKLHEMPTLQLALDEHTEVAWVNFQEALQLPLIPGSVEALEYVLLWKNSQNILN